MSNLLDRYEIIGERNARYYNIWHKMFRRIDNICRASLCQTGISRTISDWLLSKGPATPGFSIESEIWENSPVSPEHRSLNSGDLSVGIKGLPGKSGIGIGHRPNKRKFTKDAHWKELGHWIGERDCQMYQLIRSSIPYTQLQGLSDWITRNSRTPELSLEAKITIEQTIRSAVKDRHPIGSINSKL
jgi:hypothetical protein